MHGHTLRTPSGGEGIQPAAAAAVVMSHEPLLDAVERDVESLPLPPTGNLTGWMSQPEPALVDMDDLPPTAPTDEVGVHALCLHAEVYTRVSACMAFVIP